MKQKFCFYVLLIVVSLNLNSCTKHDVQILPLETQTGAGTFACVYNGRTLTYNGGYAYLISDTLRNTKSLSINGVNLNSFDDMNIFIEIQDRFIKGNTYYSFQLGSVYNYNIAGVETQNSIFTYYTDSLHNGIVEITKFDTINRIVSGRFSFKAVGYYNNWVSPAGPITNQTVEIGSGRFDLKMY